MSERKRVLRPPRKRPPTPPRPRPRVSDRCKSCGAEILWAEIDGKRIPLNKRRVRAYRSNDFRELRCGDDSVYLVHISHFVACPNASEHSKRGKGVRS